MKLLKTMTVWSWLHGLVCFILLQAMGVAPTAAYEVWLTDQSDTGKESGGYLYIYDDAKLAADAAAAKPTQTIDFSGVRQILRRGNQEAGPPTAHAVLQCQVHPAGCGASKRAARCTSIRGRLADRALVV